MRGALGTSSDDLDLGMLDATAVVTFLAAQRTLQDEGFQGRGALAMTGMAFAGEASTVRC
ncbi:MAG TPA: hypothetical protein VMS22_09615 [Candidatus Eisenbacteria bacterium]|nr:hypothetical protein [Candidatus Eisenbacteria bacterium]